MMGTTTLSEIREKLRKAIAAEGKDPIEWLEEQTRKKPENSEVLLALKRVLEEPVKPKRRRPKTKAKKVR